MTRRTTLGLLVLLLACVVGLLVGVGVIDATSSSLSRGPNGLLAARRYLERSDARVHLLDVPVDARALDDVLVTALPWQRAPGPGELDQLGWFVRRGGTLVLLYSGERDRLWEITLLDRFDLHLVTARPEPPLRPSDWHRHRTERWRLHAGQPALFGLRETVMPAPNAVPGLPDRAEVLLRGGPEELPLAFSFRLEAGRVVVLPAGLLRNSVVHEPGNVDLLATLQSWLGDRWAFDEYHHGLTATGANATEASVASWDLFGAHLIALYVLGVLALARRFGPVWRERPPVAGSAAAFLTSLGGLHRRLRHHRAAAVRLLERAHALDPNLPIGPDLEAAAERVTTDKGLVELARMIAGMQRPGRNR